MAEPAFDTLAIVGIGLIGASVARAAKARGAAGTIRLWDREADVRTRAATLELGTVCETLDAAVSGADAVLICVPVGAIEAVTSACAPHLKPGAVISDVGSVKADAARAMKAAAPATVHVIPGHPIAGTEQSGPDAGFATLFEGAWHILTPLPDGGEDYGAAVERLTGFWRSLGARVECMEPERHDRVLAITSHLPHLIAFNIVCTAYDMEQVDEGDVVKYSAGGFRDFTRIAASDPVMWRDVFLSNREAVLECLGRFSEDLAALQRAIRWGDGDLLMQEFSRARGIRKAIIDAGLDSAEADFGRRRSPGPDTQKD